MVRGQHHLHKVALKFLVRYIYTYIHTHSIVGLSSDCGHGESLSPDRFMGEVEDDEHSTALHIVTQGP